jgi:hypothetical protein
MKRTPLQRVTPLTRGGALRRNTPLTVKVPAARKPRVKDSGPPTKTREVVYARAGATDGWPGTCEWPGCTRVRTDVHHRLGRKSGGRHGEMRARLNGAAWLLAVCRVHHAQVTSPSGAVLVQARAWGWLLMEGQDARVVPVLTRHSPDLVLLDDRGDWVVATRTTPSDDA